MLTHFDDCAGIGGFAYAAQLAGGITTRWAREIDEYARAVYAKHFPDVGIFRDVRDSLPDSLTGRVGLYTAGFPCQPVSVAGRRKGTQDERWLWPHILGAIRHLRPRWCLLENVPGLLSAESGRLFGGILRDLAESGFDAEWDCIPAVAVGAPHIRDRIWVVAYPGWTGRQQESRSAHGDEGSNAGGSALQADQLTGDGERHRAGILAIPLCGGRDGESGNQGEGPTGRGRIGESGQDVSVAERVSQRAGLCEAESGREWGRRPSDGDWWATEPDVGRVGYGIPARVDRLRCLGNAIVPQVAAWIMRRIVEVEEQGQ